MLTMIDINKLEGHPNNPRKNLGDLEELANSIKESGVLQNLTVVPCNETEKQDQIKYRVIIGHRRLAASKMAGLSELPCAIVEMDTKTQLATMLLENMQRSDLTVYEEAQGMQMMLELGETVDTISEKTGFSKSTVRRRTKLLELDQDKLSEASSRGATLFDYMELDKIKNPDRKNKVLEKAGTPNFRNALLASIKEEEDEAMWAELKDKLSDCALEKQTYEECNDFKYVDSMWGDNQLDSILKKINEDKETQYYFILNSSYYGARIYREYKSDEVNPSKVQSDREAIELKRSEKKNKLEEINRRHIMLRDKFIKKFSYKKAREKIKIIAEMASISMCLFEGMTYDDMAKFYEIDIPEDIDEDEDIYVKNEIEKLANKNPEKVLLVSSYCMIRGDYFKYFNWDATWNKPVELDILYKYLQRLGYEMSDEEKQLQDGTHEIFQEE